MDFKVIIAILLQIALGILAGFYYVRIIKRPVLGHLWGAIIVGIIGGVLGGSFLDYVFRILVDVPFFNVDAIATLFGSFLLIWLFSKLAHQ